MLPACRWLGLRDPTGCLSTAAADDRRGSLVLESSCLCAELTLVKRIEREHLARPLTSIVCEAATVATEAPICERLTTSRTAGRSEPEGRRRQRHTEEEPTQVMVSAVGRGCPATILMTGLSRHGFRWRCR